MDPTRVRIQSLFSCPLLRFRDHLVGDPTITIDTHVTARFDEKNTPRPPIDTLQPSRVVYLVQYISYVCTRLEDKKTENLALRCQRMYGQSGPIALQTTTLVPLPPPKGWTKPEHARTTRTKQPFLV